MKSHRAGRRRGRLVFTILAALAMLGTATVVTAYAITAAPDTYSFFTDTDVSDVAVDPDTSPVEVGLRFTARRAGTLSAVRFLKARGDTGAHPVSVWSSAGERIGAGTPPPESRSGWQQVALDTPVPIEAGREYVVSYHTTRYRASTDYFTDRPIRSGPISTVGAGVYAYGTGGFPTERWRQSNYWVDVVFAVGDTPVPATSSPRPVPATPGTPVTTGTPSGPAAPPSSSAPAPTPSATTGGTGPLALPRVPWEGGPSYYANFPRAGAGWNDPKFFPIGVWYENVQTAQDVAKDKAAGLNTYVMLTADSDMSLIDRAGMHAMTTEAREDTGGETTAWIINDEVDMWGGAGNGTWTGKYPGNGHPCTSGKYDCGFDVMRRLSAALPAGDGRMRYANFGKGIMFWQGDQDASRFVNQYTSVVSNDVYWYTDPNVCYSSSEGPALGVTRDTCRLAANYGRTMDRMRKVDAMDGRRQPVYAFVEVGHPFTEETSRAITAPQIAGAVVNSLIHEARGILYFNHNFGGACISQHVLRDACGAAVRPTVTELNRRITALAPVLNTQSYQWTFNPRLDTMLKAYGGASYIFAMPGTGGGTGQQSLTLPAGLTGTRAEVLYENRSVPITGGKITDTFAEEYSYHIYKVTS